MSNENDIFDENEEVEEEENSEELDLDIEEVVNEDATSEEEDEVKDGLEGVEEGITGGIGETEIGTEIKGSFLEYAMSVIVARALPDARDGFKPVHRRIIFGMNAMGMSPDKPFKKSARIVGDVMGKYHPHGDTAIYRTMARLAQDFAMRYTLVDGHGNYGSQDGDEPAAMRYTEARMSKLSLEMIRDINKNTVDFTDTYDGDGKEPVVLPSRFPNLIVNGSSGIAVGMATNIPPHNLVETINAVQAIIKNPEITSFELMEHIKGPDFPGGGIILGRSGIKRYFETGSGSIRVRGKYHLEEKAGRVSIIFTELPYMVNKKDLAKKIMDLVNNKTLDGIQAIADYSSHKIGTRFQIDLKKGANAEITLNHLFKYTKLEDRFAVNMLALDQGAPKILSMKKALEIYLKFQCEVVERRARFDLAKSLDRLHILEGLIRTIDIFDEVSAVIRAAKNVDTASKALMENFGFSDKQAAAILDMKMQRLVGLEMEKLVGQQTELKEFVKRLEAILGDFGLLQGVVYDELEEIKRRFGDERRTEISDNEASDEDEDLIADMPILIALTDTGYVKRMDPDSFRVQNRGGVGVVGMTTKEDDNVSILTRSRTKTDVLFFTNFGRVFRLRGYQLPSGSRTSKGLPIVNLIGLSPEEKVLSIISVDDYDDKHYLFFVTRKGVVKRVSTDNFKLINRNGKIAIALHDDDTLFGVKYTDGESYIAIGSNLGKVCMFKETEVRAMGRTASGVRGMNLDGGIVVGALTSLEGPNILSVSAKGLGKLTPYNLYRITSRGGKGVITMRITEKTGELVSILAVNGDEHLLISTDGGTIIKTAIEQISFTGRNASGVKLISLKEGEKVASLSVDPDVNKQLEELEKEPIIEAPSTSIDDSMIKDDQLIGSEEDDV